MITDLLVQQIESCLPYEPNREQSELLQQLAAFVLDGLVVPATGICGNW